MNQNLREKLLSNLDSVIERIEKASSYRSSNSSK